MIWGALSLLGIFAFFGTIGYQLSMKGDGNLAAEDQDVRFVREWLGLSHDRDIRIEHSHNPTGSWSGDYEKIFAIKLIDFDESIILHREGVSRGDKGNIQLAMGIFTPDG